MTEAVLGVFSDDCLDSDLADFSLLELPLPCYSLEELPDLIFGVFSDLSYEPDFLDLIVGVFSDLSDEADFSDFFDAVFTDSFLAVFFLLHLLGFSVLTDLGVFSDFMLEADFSDLIDAVFSDLMEEAYFLDLLEPDFSEPDLSEPDLSEPDLTVGFFFYLMEPVLIVASFSDPDPLSELESFRRLLLPRLRAAFSPSSCSSSDSSSEVLSSWPPALTSPLRWSSKEAEPPSSSSYWP